MKERLADDLHKTNVTAREMVKGKMPDIYAENHNYGTFEVEKGARLDTDYTLYDRPTMERLMRDNPQLLPEPGRATSQRIYNKLDVRWNRQQLQSVMMQGLLQGDSIPKLATRLANEVGDKNRKAAIRNARTMATGAQNAGRIDSYKRAKDMGIEMKQEWLAVLDERTRHDHRLMDHQVQEVDHPFEAPSGETIRFPGDPSAPAYLVYNCRCKLRALVAGLQPMSRNFRDLSAIDNQDYEAWKENKRSRSNPIDLPERKGEAIRQSYIAEYRRKANSLALSGTTSNIKASDSRTMQRKKTSSNTYEPMPKKQFQRIKKAFENHGGVIDQSDDAIKRLDLTGSEAITYNEKTILARKRPSRSAIFEELIHTAQFRKGLITGGAENKCIYEIEAKEKLIKNAEAYKLTKAEIEDTKKSLEDYKQILKKLRSKNQ